MVQHVKTELTTTAVCVRADSLEICAKQVEDAQYVGGITTLLAIIAHLAVQSNMDTEAKKANNKSFFISWY